MLTAVVCLTTVNAPAATTSGGDTVASGLARYLVAATCVRGRGERGEDEDTFEDLHGKVGKELGDSS